MKQRRNTKQRKTVLDTVITRKDHPSAEQVYEEVRRENPSISRGTVYRNLHLLVDENEVRQVKIPGVDRYDWRREPHYHVLCTVCGRVTDVPVAYRAELDRSLAEQTGYEIVGHRTVFEGVCPDCRNKKEDSE
ncbi:MAG: transcriptional repressor [Oscillospiraceae bacterium]|jgi:Fe2+ or Zn2+ uptake regulation protein|nr:transcriptional repressor [Oscillospiraceae bacterium]